MKRLLFISYIFPPAGGAGVQRAAKFVKYLGQYGWQTLVLTPDRPSVPVMDPSLLADLPPGLVVRRLPSLEPASGGGSSTSVGPAGLSALARLKVLASGLIFPDRHALWLPTALPVGWAVYGLSGWAHRRADRARCAPAELTAEPSMLAGREAVGK